MTNFTVQDIRQTLQSIPLSQAQQLGRENKCIEGIDTFLSGGTPRYNSFIKVIPICKKINSNINWEYPPIETIRDYFYTSQVSLERKYRDALFKPTNLSLDKYMQLWSLYDHNK